MKKSIPMKIILSTISILLIFSAIAKCYSPTYNPKLDIKKTKGEIEIDAELTDSGWRSKSIAENFAEHRPGDQTEPPVKTEAWITYDDAFLYVAFICYDDPKEIRANYNERDHMGNDDNICLLIDTYGEAAWAYELNVNPYGIQGDYLWSKNGGEDAGTDLIWDAAGKITDSGYQVEMAVPFSSLRFPNKINQTWKVDFWRNHPRDSRRQYSWAAYDRNNPCWPCQWGTISGIEDVSPGKGIELLPNIVGYSSGSLNDADNPNSNWSNSNFETEISMGGKYAITSSITAEATYNPDFSQIESDVAQIDVNSTFALFFPERRPFFQEGSDLYNTYLSAVYTRSINDPVFASKLIGRIGKTSISYLTAVDENSPIMIPLREKTGIALGGESASNIFRIRQGFGEDDHIGFLFTDRRFTDDKGSGTVAGFDGSYRFAENFRFEAQWLSSHVRELDDPSLIDTTSDNGMGQVYLDDGSHTVLLDGEKYWGHNAYLSFEYSDRSFSFDIDYNEESPTFRADNGFIFMNGTRSTEFWTSYTIFNDTRTFDFIEPRLGYGRVWTYDEGEFKDEWLWYEIGVQLKAQTYVEFGGLLSEESFRGVHFDRIMRHFIYINSNFSNPLSLGLRYSYGHMIARQAEPVRMGRETNFELWATMKPTKKLKISPQYIFFRSKEMDTDDIIYDDFVFRTNLTYQFTKEFQIRLITQYHDSRENWEFDPLVSFELTPFSILYAGSTHNFHNFPGLGLKETHRQFFFKIQHLFRI